MILNQRAGKVNRQGFTLIELLTVIAIIAVILSLAIGAFFRIRVSQEESATETTIFKIQNQFDAQWRAVLDNCKQDARTGASQPNSVPGFSLADGMSAGDSRRRLVIWTKIQLKREFPQNLYEALVWPVLWQAQGIQLKSGYVTALNKAGITFQQVQQVSPSLSVDQLMQESAVMLYMSMTQARRGVTGFNPTEHVGPHAIGQATLDWYPSAPTFPVFIDTWGRPIGFIRWPLNAGAASDLNQPPHQAKNNQGQPIDPQDPERTLLDADWMGNANLVALFAKVVEYNPTISPAMISAGVPANLSPVICSSGRDKLWGIDALFGRLTSDEDDNIYGYRIKGVNRSSN